MIWRAQNSTATAPRPQSLPQGFWNSLDLDDVVEDHGPGDEHAIEVSPARCQQRVVGVARQYGAVRKADTTGYWPSAAPSAGWSPRVEAAEG